MECRNAQSDRCNVLENLSPSPRSWTTTMATVFIWNWSAQILPTYSGAYVSSGNRISLFGQCVTHGWTHVFNRIWSVRKSAKRLYTTKMLRKGALFKAVCITCIELANPLCRIGNNPHMYLHRQQKTALCSLPGETCEIVLHEMTASPQSWPEVSDWHMLAGQCANGPKKNLYKMLHNSWVDVHFG